jgi:nucleotide-binding universal stress UspA family protein
VIRTILVPLDGSAFGEHALPMAASLARSVGAMLHLVHVHQSAPPVPTVGFEMINLFDLHLREDELAYLSDVKRRVAEACDVPVTSALLGEGDVVRSLRAYADDHAIEMVALATHGRGALGRWWLGSVADELARTMTRPVVLVRPGEGRTDLRQRPALRSIVVALDGTASAEQVLEPAVRLGEPFGAAFALVRVCPPVIRSSYLPEGTTLHGLTHGALEQLAALQRKAEGECRDYLDGVAMTLRGRGLHVTTHAPVEEEPADGILAVARARHADLIAMETHGRRGLSRLFKGSVADRVVRGGEAPVMLNRPRGDAEQR